MPLVYGGDPASEICCVGSEQLPVNGSGKPLKDSQVSLRRSPMLYHRERHFIKTRFDISGFGRRDRVHGREGLLPQMLLGVQLLPLKM